MFAKRKMTPAAIAKALGRNKSSITRLLFRKKKRSLVGRPKALTEKQVGSSCLFGA